MKYRFNDESETVIELEYPHGDHDLECMAKVRYEFGKGDVRLLINDYYFGVSDFDELIDLLRAMQAKLRETK